MSRYRVQIREGKVWEESGEESLTISQALRIARDIRRECGCDARVVPEGAPEARKADWRDEVRDFQEACAAGDPTALAQAEQ